MLRPLKTKSKFFCTSSFVEIRTLKREGKRNGFAGSVLGIANVRNAPRKTNEVWKTEVATLAFAFGEKEERAMISYESKGSPDWARRWLCMACNTVGCWIPAGKMADNEHRQYILQLGRQQHTDCPNAHRQHLLWYQADDGTIISLELMFQQPKLQEGLEETASVS